MNVSDQRIVRSMMRVLEHSYFGSQNMDHQETIAFVQAERMRTVEDGVSGYRLRPSGGVQCL